MRNAPIIPKAAILVSLAGAGLFTPRQSSAQTACESSGPDVIVGDITGPSNYASLNGIEAFSWGGAFCNIGDQGVLYSASTNQHPVFGQSLFRLKVVDGAARIEQIGQSWLQHGFFALSQALCCTGCQGTDGTTLGVHCADPTTASRAGSQAGLGPRHQVDAARGSFAYPPANPNFSGSVARRMQARITDLDPSLEGGGQYFAQTQAIAPDDAAAQNDDNNCSYRPVLLSGSGSAWNMSLTGQTVRERAAIQAWKAADPGVSEVFARVPDDGLFIVAAKATLLASGVWRYEYAAFNMNSHRSAREFSIGLPVGATLSNPGFHDVDYHSGDGTGNVNFDGTDWAVTVASDRISWSTSTFAANPSANALRWGTLYNFRFDCDVPPMSGQATLGLFRPGEPSAISIGGVPVPLGAPPLCAADFNTDQVRDVRDIFAFLSAWFALCDATSPCPDPAEPAPPCYCKSADFDGNGVIAAPDIFTYLSVWFASASEPLCNP